MASDLLTVLIWWAAWMVFGWIGTPMTSRLFEGWSDKGYLLAKAMGIGLTTYLVWLLGMWKIITFDSWSVFLVGITIWAVSGKIIYKNWREAIKQTLKIRWKEIFFLVPLIFWAYIKAHEPTINGLEKFMDYGFLQSILQSKHFPPADMWYAGEGINYYYFGHLLMAVASKMSGIGPAYSFNLMLATIFALMVSMGWAIMTELLVKEKARIRRWGALLAVLVMTLGGNLHTIYAFTRGYSGDNPPPFWKIWSNIRDKESFLAGWKSYWYPNATRFIPYTIHEFPGYSFVVSDMHGHVLAIPFALLLIALMWNIFNDRGQKKQNSKLTLVIFGLIVGWSFMTNTLDAPIYMGTLAILLVVRDKKNWWKDATIAIVAFGLAIVPFLLTFKPFVSGLAVNCPPKMLQNTRIGPLIFEGLEKCQRSPGWMLLILWGFFLVNIGFLMSGKPDEEDKGLWLMMATMSIVCLGLIIFPEFFYFKDIYPMHFRSNTMFKLGYQAFIMLSFAFGYTFSKWWFSKRNWKWLYRILVTPLLVLVLIYPYFSVRSYFRNLESYEGIYGLGWIQEKYPDDFAAINWLLKTEGPGSQPIILEANGDSYTDYDIFSTFTGFPTVAGWTVHEWLWRGGYEPIAKRAEEVRKVYEADDPVDGLKILDKYNVKYIILGNMERDKYQINNDVVKSYGSIVFSSGTTEIIQREVTDGK